MTELDAGKGMYRSETPPRGDLLVWALVERPDGAHAALCLGRLVTRGLHIKRQYSTSAAQNVLICIKTRDFPAWRAGEDGISAGENRSVDEGELVPPLRNNRPPWAPRAAALTRAPSRYPVTTAMPMARSTE